MLNLFRQAAAGANLSPMARAVLRLVEGLAATALVAVLPVIAQLLSNGLDAGAVDWGNIGRVALAAFAVAFLMALSKWAKAHGDAPLSMGADAAAGYVASVAALSSSVISELDAAQLPNTADPGPLGLVGTPATMPDGSVVPIVSVAALASPPSGEANGA